MTKFLFDSSAWVEVFTGRDKYSQVLELHEKADVTYITAIDLYQVCSSLEQSQGIEQATKKRELIERTSSLVEITKEIALKAIELRRKKKMTSLVCLTLAACEVNSATLVTLDPHFKGIKNVVYLGE